MEEGEFEGEHVQQVYEAIAPHFSATRYKRWPIVEKFIKNLPKGSFGCDFGCGNGKNLEMNKCMTIGMDACTGLLEICNEKGFEILQGTIMKDPFRSNIFDFSLSIAVLHHLRTPNRRLEAIKEMLRVMRVGGIGLIFVWAFEDNKSVRRHKLTILDGNDQDVLVPWSMVEYPKKPNKKLKVEEEDNKRLKVEAEDHKRLKVEGEDQDIAQDDQDQFKKDQDIDQDNQDIPKDELNSFQRYYHLFKRGELDDLIEKAGGSILETGYDRDNWYIQFQK